MLHQSAAVVESDPFGADYSQGLPTLGQGPVVAPTQVVIRGPNVPILVGSVVLFVASAIVYYVSLGKKSTVGVIAADVMGMLGMAGIPAAFVIGHRQ